MIYFILVIIFVIWVYTYNKNNTSKTTNHDTQVRQSKSYTPMYPAHPKKKRETIVHSSIDNQLLQADILINKYKNFDDMIKATIPEGLEEKEIKFFRKWYKKFHFNNVIATEGFIKFRNNWTTSNPLRYRDHLSAYRTHLDTKEWNKTKHIKKTKAELDFENARKLTLNSEYMIDEIKLIGAKTKNGEYRTQVKHIFEFLTRAIMDHNSSIFDTYKKLIIHIEKYYPDQKNQIGSIISIALHNIVNISKTNETWLYKKLEKYPIPVNESE